MQNSKLQFKNQRFTKVNIKDIPVENAHSGTGKRQVLLNKQDVTSSYWEAVTKGFLDAGSAFDWHTHSDIDEVFVVLKGSGKFYCENEEIKYHEKDVFCIPANLKHKIVALEDGEFFFIRIKI